MPTLAEVFAKHGGDYPKTDRGTIHKAYLPVYEELLRGRRVDRLLEVGVRDGSSLRAWADLYPTAAIYGIDNWSEGPKWEPDPDDETPYIHVATGDVCDPGSIPGVIDEWYESHCSEDALLFDVIIEDALHHPYSQTAALFTLWPYLAEGGLYVVEDVEDIGFANKMAGMFGGRVIDLREVNQRHDDILVVFEGR